MLASEFLQNIVFINLQLSDQEKIERFIALSNLYNQVKQAVWYILYGIHIFFFPFAIFFSIRNENDCLAVCSIAVSFL